MDDNLFHIHCDDCPKLTKDISSTQQTSSSYEPIYHQNIIYSNTSFHRHDQLINTNNIYNAQQFGHRRRYCTIFTQSYIQQLDSVFVYNRYLDLNYVNALLLQWVFSETRIQAWFKNQRTHPVQCQ
ncbi:unnamed protein product [Rotaria sp. Silwood2]|nr:unnamed protein product [Rotaria sp. Silwood2]CAF2659321.1 unnamed protein product [Rotaria sp. Silwood2]CAF3026614.1 unnamed protein product [Rotaria sp. Silwood2]CAF3894915.1 unnamed protein product [Rotaria sp. Silwood2]CAF4070037.1 unnamed protein product [Rotaria sp. Silwood2]